MKTGLHLLRVASLAALCTLMLNATTTRSATFVESKVNGDDQFKIYISADISDTAIQPEGLQYANGFIWYATYTNTLLLPENPETETNYKNYWINIWVQDLASGGPVLLGQFTLTDKPAIPGVGSVAGCTFDNGKTTIVTSNNSLWKVTNPLPQVFGPVTPTGYSEQWNRSNYLPTWVRPTLKPRSLGLNGVAPWGTQSGISTKASWITTPLSSEYPSNHYTEAWFSTHIKCP